MAASGPLADSVMVLPYGSYEPSYSNVLYGPPLIFKGVDPRSLAPILGTPHVVAPCMLHYLAKLPRYIRSGQ